MSELLLDSLEIKGYRCFEHLTIEKLGRVNLILGKNNVGKTALLEALWIYVNKGRVFNEILQSRNEDTFPASLQNKTNKFKSLINHSSNSLLNEIKIGRLSEDNSLFFQLNSEVFTYRGILNDITQKAFIKTDGLDQNKIIEFWDNIELTPKEEENLKSMQVIMKNLLKVRVRVTNKGRIPYAQVAGIDESLPLRSFGDGLNRLFGISLALANCKDGVLLIDEIENGFHYSILPDVWKLIFKTAKDLNVQVFATTHSKDCIEAFTQAAIDDKESEGMLIRLERNKSDKIIAKTIVEERLAQALEHDVEVR
jgi:AAA15 family ATPase/GTPase